MNNSYSRPENYVPRWDYTPAAARPGRYPVLVLTGARQVGKSTLLLNEKAFQRLSISFNGRF